MLTTLYENGRFENAIVHFYLLLNGRFAVVATARPGKKCECGIGVSRSFMPATRGHFLCAQIWRREWDSNPRWHCCHAGFQDRCLKPLGHPSSVRNRSFAGLSPLPGNPKVQKLPPQIGEGVCVQSSRALRSAMSTIAAAPLPSRPELRVDVQEVWRPFLERPCPWPILSIRRRPECNSILCAVSVPTSSRPTWRWTRLRS
jgi:hypothetical protein